MAINVFKPDSVLIVGGGGDIAQALVKQLQENYDLKQLVIVSRNADELSGATKKFSTDYSEKSIHAIATELLDEGILFSHVFIFNGALSGNGLYPEKKIEELCVENLQRSFYINAIIPAIFIKELLPILKRSSSCDVVVYSARLASISDNRLGGWYSYRSSKAALNMLIKNASIEYQRRAKNVSFILFHPGTVNTRLSRPFTGENSSKNVFTTTFAANNLIEILKSLDRKASIEYVDWRGEQIAW